MKTKIQKILLVLAIATGILAIPVAAQAIPIPGANCIVSFSYYPDPNHPSSLTFSYNNGLFQTPVRRAGACGHVYVQSLGVAAAPPCFIARIRTYNEDGSVNYDGRYLQWDRVGQIRDIREGYISNNRRYRIFAVPCDRDFRNPSHPPGFHVYTHQG